jgi:hypothetical protein
MSGTMNFKMLKDKQRNVREGFPDNMGLRVHRAINWIGRAKACGEDTDAKFIFYWIAFNATYADECELQLMEQGEHSAFLDFFPKLVKLDAERRIYKAIWQRFSGPVRLLLENRYVFNPFWQHPNGIAGNEDWESRFAASSRKFATAFQVGDSGRVLTFLFDRLYVLRNQIVHGGSTWNSAVNRAQVRDGAAILDSLLPMFVNLMMDNPQDDWGQQFYPVVK